MGCYSIKENEYIAFFHKGDNVCDLFAFLYTIDLLERVPL